MKHTKFAQFSVTSILLINSFLVPISAKDVSDISQVQCNNMQTDSAINRSINGEWTRTVEVSRTIRSKKFIGYHSGYPNFAGRSAYNITAGVSASASIADSFDGIGFNISVSRTESSSSTIPANSNRLSRLGIYADVQVRHMQTQFYDNQGMYSKRDYIEYDILATYLIVVYQ